MSWVIVGGESGRNSRPIDPGWVRAIRDECAKHGVAFFFKQWGDEREKPEDEPDGAKGGNYLDGEHHLEFPAPPVDVRSELRRQLIDQLA